MSTDTEERTSGYAYRDGTAAHTAAYLWPTVFAELAQVPWPGGPRQVFDLGCGNGALVAALLGRGYTPAGADPSEDGIRFARAQNAGADLQVGSAYDDLAAAFGRFPAVVSLEVVEHVFYPRKYARGVYDLLEPGGIAILSTPYHGYWKNLALAVTGKWDAHLSPLWDYGHIKFWSAWSLGVLLAEAGLTVERTIRVGRIPPLAKSMIVVARRPRG